MDTPPPGVNTSDITTAWAFKTGVNEWEKLASWPPRADDSGRARTPQEMQMELLRLRGLDISPGTPLYLTSNFGLSFSYPKDSSSDSDTYISDPAKPVPYRKRPAQPIGYDYPLTWPEWLTDDQREQSGRPDVLSYTSDVLTEPVQISGQPVAHLVASTSGTDSDWVVKLIDVYPDEVASQPDLGGYQLMISADIFRGRYRESFAVPHAIPPNDALEYTFNLPPTNHVFLPGHRIMVQVQSSWFPLYDRNPQTFVPNIFWAKPSDYHKAEQKIWHAPGHQSYIELPLVKEQN